MRQPKVEPTLYRFIQHKIRELLFIVYFSKIINFDAQIK